MTKVKTILSVWIGNLGDYNAGVLRGQWFNLDDYDLDELTAAVNELTNGGINDYYIADSMSDYGVKVDEYDGLDALIEKYETIKDFIEKYDDSAANILEAFTETISDDLSNINHYEFFVYSDCYSMADVAYECGLEEIPEHLRSYFDYAAYGRDMEINGTFYYTGGGVYIEIVG